MKRALLLLLIITVQSGYSTPARISPHTNERRADVLSDWKLVWSDEFNNTGLPDPTKWKYDTGGHGWGNKELQFYT